MSNRITKGEGLFGRLVANSANIGGMEFPSAGFGGTVRYVDGTNGSDSFSGRSKAQAFATIQAAVTASAAGDVILVVPKAMAAGATDPGSYAEAIVVPATKAGLAIIGLGTGMTQGGLPQIKVGAGTAPNLTVQAPGVLLANVGINGAGATGGGVLLDGDASTKDAMGFIARGCHFKNCKGSAAAATGGAVYWGSNGSCWQARIEGCHFYNNRAGIVLVGTGVSVPQDVAIVGCEFVGEPNTAVDADIFLSGGSGMIGLLIDDCRFGTVDVPAYATAPSAARYIDVTDCKGSISRCTFACTGKTFGAAGDAALIPTTVRLSACYQESGLIART